MLSWIKRITSKGGRRQRQSVPGDAPVIIPRAEHTISRSNISDSALKVLYRLHNSGYEAYLVGGAVRDLLLGREPKDFDIATSAHPEEVRQLFRNSRLIGRRFRLAHVRYGRDVIEVATFRGHHEQTADDEHLNDSGMIVRDNVYGTLEEDAWRRDFSVNALYYNIADFSVVDFTGGMADLDRGQLSMIGDPEVRFREDPVRMMRAVRFAVKLGFRIDPAVEQAIIQLGPMLGEVAPARLFDEVLKLFMHGYAVEAFELLRHYDLFADLFPETDEWLSHEENNFPLTLLIHALESTDLRVDEGKPITPAFLFAALLWEPVRHLASQLQGGKLGPIQALQEAGDTVVARQMQRVAVPKRFTLQSREIWTMQERLARRQGKRSLLLLEHPRFRAAYDFLVLRAQSGEAVQELADWWTHFQEEDEEGRDTLSRAIQQRSPAKRRRRRPKSRQRPGGEQ